MATTDPVPAAGPLRARLRADVARLARVMLVAVPLGAVSVGLFSRLAMFLLARANPSAAGMTSDDGFTIDQFTLSGSLNLVVVGLFFGALSGVCWVVLAPLAFGPAWFQRVSLAVGAGVVAASQVVHSDGVDFVVLDNPFLLAVVLFVLIPVLHVLVLDLLASRVLDRGSFRGPRWTLVGLVLALPMAPLVAVVALLRALQLAVLTRGGPAGALRWHGWRWSARVVLTVIFVVAGASVAADVVALT